MKTGVISLAVMGLLVAVGASGCGNATAPLRLSEEPLWTSNALGLDGVDAAKLLDDRVVAQEPFNDRLVTVDAASGDVIWSVEGDQQLLGGDGEIVAAEDGFSGPNGELVITGSAEDWDVIVPYRTDPEEENDARYGVAALSGEDGAVEWKQELASVDDEEDLRELPRPVLAAGGVVLVRPWGHDVIADSTVTALNAENGDESWEQDLDGWPVQAEQDMFVVLSDDLSNAETDGRGWSGSTDDTAVWDARNGEKLWDMSDKWESSQVEAVVNETAIIGVDEAASREHRYIAVGLESGERLADLGVGSGRCAGDGAYTVACEDLDEIITIDTRDHSATRVGNPYFGDEVEAELLGVHHGRVFMRVTEDEQDAEVNVVDGDGTVIGRDAPGYPLAITENFALFGGKSAMSYRSMVGLYEVVSS